VVVHQATVVVLVQDLAVVAATTHLLLPTAEAVTVVLLLSLHTAAVTVVEAGVEATATPAELPVNPGGKSTKHMTHFRFISDLFLYWDRFGMGPARLMAIFQLSSGAILLRLFLDIVSFFTATSFNLYSIESSDGIAMATRAFLHHRRPIFKPIEPTSDSHNR